MKRMWSKNELKKIVKGTQGYNFANLVDKDGHPRFIEGNITIETISGITKSYGKWSLSGTHLMIVLACSVADATAIDGGTLANITLPEWITNKIVPTFSNAVLYQSVSMYADNWTSQSLGISLRKPSSNELRIAMESTVILTADRNFRVQFDLLIDNE